MNSNTPGIGWFILELYTPRISADNSILASVKKFLGISQECTDFDYELIIHINSVFMILSQLGVGPIEGFSIKDDTTQWNEYLDDREDLESVKTYMGLKVKLLFDPPLTYSVIESTNRMIAKLEWKLNVSAESNDGRDPENE